MYRPTGEVGGLKRGGGVIEVTLYVRILLV